MSLSVTELTLCDIPETVHLAGPPLAAHSFGLSDAGRVRPANEDRFLITELQEVKRVRPLDAGRPTPRAGAEGGRLLLVADGMGGHRAGCYASALAVATVEDFLRNSLGRPGRPEGEGLLDALCDAVRKADERVTEAARRRPEFHGMGTTLTLALVAGADLLVAHAGDSRCYLQRGGALRRLTEDHNLAGEMVRNGCLAAREAPRHQFRHVLTNAVGGPPGVRVEANRARLRPGDWVLLCTDGLTEMVTDEAIAAALRDETDPRRACERLVASANLAGGKDNVTVVAARLTAGRAA
jgi:protein phosphatase